MDINRIKINNYYEQVEQHLKDVMQMEHKNNPIAQKHSLKKYAEVKTPFQFYMRGNQDDAFDYNMLYILLLVILCTAADTPTFSNEYQTGSDSILRCTRHGRSRLAMVKVFCCIDRFFNHIFICILLQ